MDLARKTLISNIISSYLVADPSSSRKSIRTLLMKLGAKPHQIEVADALDSTLDTIKSKKPQVIFIDHALAKNQLAQIAQIQRQSVPKGNPRALFLITSSGSRSDASEAADSGDVDSIIVRPFTFQDMNDQVNAILEEKFFPNPLQQLLAEGRDLLESDQLDEALARFQKASEMNPASAVASACMGAILLKQGKTKEARKTLEKGLKQNPTHYRSLLGMIDVLTIEKDFKLAYECARKLAEHHPIPVSRLPNFVKLSVVNFKFEDVLDFYRLVDGIHSVEGEASTYLSAGLVVCGLFFLKGKSPEEAVPAFRKAEQLANGNPAILTRIVVALAGAGLESELRVMLPRMPKSVQDSIEVRIARLEHLKDHEPLQALSNALELIRAGTEEPQVYRIAIQLSIALKRTDRAINEIVESARKLFPALKEEWDRFNAEIAKTGVSD